MLRRLPEAESRGVEEAILLEDDVAERLRAEELDLLSDYATQRLSTSERVDVEQYLLTTGEARHSLRVAGLLAREGRPESIRPTPAGRSGWRHFSPPRRAALAAVMSVALLAVVLWPRWRAEAPIASLPSSVASQSPADAAVASPAPASAAPAVALPTVTLLMDVNRGANSPPLAWPSAAPVRLQLEVPARGRGPFLVFIEDGQGHSRFQSGPLTAQDATPYRYVETIIPAQTLVNGVNKVLLRSANAAPTGAATFQWKIGIPATR